MALYTEASIERVRDAVDMVALVGARTDLRRAGANRYQGLCPFHEERTPSFGIDPVKKVFHCFGCGEGGSEVDFVMKTEGVDFKAAIELLADRVGVELEVADEDPREAERRARRARMYDLLQRTAAFYVRYLWESREAGKARAYLAERGLEEEWLRKFRVGYAPSAWDKVLMASRTAGFSNDDLLATGLAKRSHKNERQIFDHFRGRIMFPLADTRGRVIGFGARGMGDYVGGKYLNTPEGELFHKRETVYAADLARVTAAKSGRVIVCEGYTDVIALHQAGFENAVCIMGTSLTEQQVKVVRRLAPVALLALDADNAGQEAMLRAARVAGSEQLELRVVPLPPGLDPADLVAQRGKDEMGALLGRSMPFVRFRVQRALAQGDVSSAEGKDHVLDALRPVMADVPPSVLREELLRTISDRLDLPETLVEQLLAARGPAPRGGAAGRAAPRGGQRAPVRDDFGDPGPEPREWDDPGRAATAGAGASDLARIVAQTEEVERRFLAFCLARPELGAESLRRLDPEEHFTSALTRRTALHLREHIDAPDDGVADDDGELQAFITELAVRGAREPVSPATLDAQRLQLELRRLDRRLESIRRSGEAGAMELASRRAVVKAELDQAVEQAVNAS